MATLWDRTTGALKSPVSGRTVLGVAGTAVVVWLCVWLSAGHAGRHETKRWQGGGTVFETETFKEYINHKDKAQSQPRALYHLASQPAVPERENPDGPIVSNPNPDWSVPHMSVYSVPNNRPPHPRPTLRDLGDHGQARAIEYLGQVTAQGSHPWDDLRKALSDDDEPGEKDPFLFERVLVASVTKGAEWQPSDRMVWTRTFVQPINFKFAAYTIAETENETVKVSSVESTNVRKLSADIGLTIPGLEGPKFDIGPSRESTVKTTTDINTQYERLGVDIMPEFLRIVRESVAGGDILGNTKVALSVVTDPGLIQRVFPADKQYRPIDADIALVVTDVHLDDGDNPDSKDSIKVVAQAPLPHCALRARVWALYEQRHVYGGDEYYDESRQRVVFIRSVDEKRDVEIIGADDVSPTVWKIQIVRKGERPSGDWNGRSFLQANLKNGVPRDLVFSDYGRATKVAHWVRTHPGQGAANNLEFSYKAEDSEAGAGLVVVKNLSDDCAIMNQHDGTKLVQGGKAGPG
jgi:hypothetical protein